MLLKFDKYLLDTEDGLNYTVRLIRTAKDSDKEYEIVVGYYNTFENACNAILKDITMTAENINNINDIKTTLNSIVENFKDFLKKEITNSKQIFTAIAEYKKEQQDLLDKESNVPKKRGRKPKGV